MDGQPQFINKASQFNSRTTVVCISVCKARRGADLDSVTDNGVGCASKLVCDQLHTYLQVECRHVGIIDTNHNGKKFYYQHIGGSCISMVGNHINDIVILQLGGVSKSLWKVKDYALELIVLKLASAGTSKKS